MELLNELLSNVKRLDQQSDDELEDLDPEDDQLEDLDPEDDELDPEELDDLDPEDGEMGDLDPEDGEMGDLDPEDGELDAESDTELDQVANKVSEDPDRQGLIRTVPKAHLVYKRETEDGTFEELWFYASTDSMKDELKIRRAIVSGTDIPVNKTNSPDGKQSYTVWTAGNAELLNIKGLPN